MQLIYRKMKFWSFPGVGHLHTVLSPTMGFLYEPPGPIMGQLLLFQNKITNSQQMSGGLMDTLGID